MEEESSFSSRCSSPLSSFATIPINDIKAWLVELKVDLQTIPLVRNYFENIRSTKLTRKIAEIEAYIYINENETDYDGFIGKLPKIHYHGSKITDIVNNSYNSYKYILVKNNKFKSKK